MTDFAELVGHDLIRPATGQLALLSRVPGSERLFLLDVIGDPAGITYRLAANEIVVDWVHRPDVCFKCIDELELFDREAPDDFA